MIKGPGVTPWSMNAPNKRAITTFDGMPNVKKRNKGSARGGVVCRFGASNSFDRSFSKLFRMSGELLLHGIGCKGGNYRSSAWKDSEKKTQESTSAYRHCAGFPIFSIRQ